MRKLRIKCLESRKELLRNLPIIYKKERIGNETHASLNCHLFGEQVQKPEKQLTIMLDVKCCKSYITTRNTASQAVEMQPQCVKYNK